MRRKKRQTNTEREILADYRIYHYSAAEFCRELLLFGVADAGISYLFYRSWTAFALGWLCFGFFLKERRTAACQKRKRELEGQFAAAMQAVTTSLTAGYSAETAFEDAYRELPSMYRREDMIMREFAYIVSQLQMNRNLEELLSALGDRSGIDDIRNFAEIFAIAKRSGGDLITIIRNTMQSISRKHETRKEIEVILSAKRLEQNIMSVIPCMILLYVQLVSPGFLDGMYHNLPGIAVMSLSLAVYAAAVLWGRSIVNIEV